MTAFLKPLISPALINFVRPSPHSTFSPSAADRWLNCPYSINACKGIPEEKSKYSEEGTLAHSLCEALFRKEFYGLEVPPELMMELTLWDNNNEGAFDEMMNCAQGYVDVINYWVNNTEDIGEVLWFGLEKGVPIYANDGCFGTADCLVIGTKGTAIIDYKHGKGKNVSPNSLQLKVYAVGIMRHIANVAEDYKFHSVIFQPRIEDMPKHHAYSIHDIADFAKEVESAIKTSKRSDLTPCEGSHCFWCPAKRTKDLKLKCKLWADKPIALANEEFDKFLAAQANTEVENKKKRDEAIIKLRALFPLIKQIYEESEDEFMQRLQEGEVIDGVRLVEVMGKRQLNAENDEQAKKLIEEKFPKIKATKIIPAKEKLKTITEIEKEIGKGKLDPLCIKKVTKKVDILDNKIRSILGEMSEYSMMINNVSKED